MIDYKGIMDELVDVENLALSAQGLSDALRWEDCINPERRREELENILIEIESKVREIRFEIS